MESWGLFCCGILDKVPPHVAEVLICWYIAKRYRFKRILFKNPGTNAVTGPFLLLHLGPTFTDR